MDKVLTTTEAAEHLGVRELSVLCYIEAGRLEASKIGWGRI